MFFLSIWTIKILHRQNKKAAGTRNLAKKFKDVKSTENMESNQYMDEVRIKYDKLYSAYTVFTQDEGIRELTQSNQLSQHDQLWIGMLFVALRRSGLECNEILGYQEKV